MLILCNISISLYNVYIGQKTNILLNLWVFETGCQLVLSDSSEKARANTVPSKKDLSRHKWSLMTFFKRRKSLKKVALCQLALDLGKEVHANHYAQMGC